MTDTDRHLQRSHFDAVLEHPTGPDLRIDDPSELPDVELQALATALTPQLGRLLALLEPRYPKYDQ